VCDRPSAFVCCSQKLQLLATTEIQTPISYGSFVTEKLGLKMEIPSAQFSEESSAYRRQGQVVSEWEYKQIVRVLYIARSHLLTYLTN